MTQVTPTSAPSVAVPPLVVEALGKSGLLWIDIPGDRPWPAWHVLVEDAAYVVSGPGEQQLPDLPPRVGLVLRSKSTGGRLLTVDADAQRVTPQDARWEQATQALAAARLNGVGDLVQRWSQTGTVTALVPRPGTLVGPADHPDGSGAAPPPPTVATTRGRQPWHLHGRPQRRRRARRSSPEQ